MIVTWSGRQAEIRGSVCISKSKRSLCISFFRTDSFVRMIKFQYLAQFSMNHLIHPVVLLFHSFGRFSLQLSLMVFHKSLSNSKSFLVSRTLLSIQASLKNVIFYSSNFLKWLLFWVFHNCKTPQIFWTFLSILADLKNAGQSRFVLWFPLFQALIFKLVFLSQNPQEFYAYHFLGQILNHACTIYLYDEICIIPCRSPFIPIMSARTFLLYQFVAFALWFYSPAYFIIKNN